MELTALPTTEALILTGSGYGLEISPAALALKAQLMETAAAVLRVTDNDESGDAQLVIRKLAGVRTMVEKCRKEIKEPVLTIGKLIDTTAKAYLREIEQEENRIRNMVGQHAAEVARRKAEAEAAERRAFEEARAAREAALAAQQAAEAASAAKQSMAEVMAARAEEKEAEAARQASLDLRLNASAEVAAAKVADGVRFAWDFEVTKIRKLYETDSELVEMTPRRSLIMQKIKELSDRYNDDTIAEILIQVGIRAFKKPVVSSR